MGPPTAQSTKADYKGLLLIFAVVAFGGDLAHWARGLAWKSVLQLLSGLVPDAPAIITVVSVVFACGLRYICTFFYEACQESGAFMRGEEDHRQQQVPQHNRKERRAQQRARQSPQQQRQHQEEEQRRQQQQRHEQQQHYRQEQQRQRQQQQQQQRQSEQQEQQHDRTQWAGMMGFGSQQLPPGCAGVVREVLTAADFYRVLQITPGSLNLEALKKARKARALAVHPDKAGVDMPGTTQAIQRVNLAYETLSNPVSRHEYDAWLATKRPQGRATGRAGARADGSGTGATAGNNTAGSRGGDGRKKKRK